MIRRVKIQGYKSLKDVEIYLHPLALFVGPNAAGKSNLFDALNLLSYLVTAENLNTAFDHHRGSPLEAFYFGPKKAGEAQNGKKSFTIEVEIELSANVIRATNRELPSNGHQAIVAMAFYEQLDENKSYLLRYTLTIEGNLETGGLAVSHECLEALNFDRPQQNLVLISRENEQVIVVAQGRGKGNYYIDPHHVAISRQIFGGAHTLAIATGKELSSWRFYQLDPKLLRKDMPLQEVTVLRGSGEGLSAFYHTLKNKELRQYNSLNKSLNLLLDIDAAETHTDIDNLLRLQIVEKGVSYSLRVISEGTLRVLAVLAIVSPMSLSRLSVLGYEEPENGVHPRRMKLIAELLKNAVESGTQVLINTHSPILPDYFEPESIVLCRKQDQQTTFIPFSRYSQNGHATEAIFMDMPPTSFAERMIRGDFDE